MIASEKIRISTTIEARISSARVGQETLFISASTAIRKSAKAGTLTKRYDPHRPASKTRPGRRELVLQPLAQQQCAKPPRPQRDRHGQGRKGDLAGNPPLRALINANPYQFCKQRGHRKWDLLLAG